MVELGDQGGVEVFAVFAGGAWLHGDPGVVEPCPDDGCGGVVPVGDVFEGVSLVDVQPGQHFWVRWGRRGLVGWSSSGPSDAEFPAAHGDAPGGYPELGADRLVVEVLGDVQVSQGGFVDVERRHGGSLSADRDVVP